MTRGFVIDLLFLYLRWTIVLGFFSKFPFMVVLFYSVYQFIQPRLFRQLSLPGTETVPLIWCGWLSVVSSRGLYPSTIGLYFKINEGIYIACLGDRFDSFFIIGQSCRTQGPQNSLDNWV